MRRALLLLGMLLMLLLNACGGGGGAAADSGGTAPIPPAAVADPTFGVTPGAYLVAQSVTLSTTTAGATIRYTMDGSAPTSSSGTIYSGAIPVGSTTTIKAIAFKSGMSDSSVSSGTYTIIRPPVPVAAPTFTPAPGVYGTAQSVSISTMTPGAMIRYTTDGSTPTSTTGTIYSGPVTIGLEMNRTTTIKAIAYLAGWADSAIAIGAYSIVDAISAPAFGTAPGSYATAQNVELASATSGAAIRYTTDGSTPTSTHGTLYAGPIPVSATTTIKAIAYASGLPESPVTSGIYTIAGRGVLALSADSPPSSLSEGAEIILVSGYESADRINTDVRVLIDRPGSKVLLSLSSYSAIGWHVDVTPGTTVTGILVYTMVGRSSLETSFDALAYSANLGFSYQANSIRFVKILAQLNRIFGTDRVDAFRGYYSLPATITISDPDPPSDMLTLAGPPVVAPGTNFDFNLYDNTFQLRSWDLTGPKNPPADNQSLTPVFGKTEQLIAFSDDLRMAYTINGNGIQVQEVATGQKTVVPLPGTFPVFSWAMGIAYDTQRNTVAVITLGGEGFFYRFDALSNSWIDYRSFNFVDVTSMIYHKDIDRFIALAGFTGSSLLLQLSDNGSILDSQSLNGKLAGFDRLYDPGNERGPILSIRASGNDLALIAVLQGSPQGIWHYDLATGIAELTYKPSTIGFPATAMPARVLPRGGSANSTPAAGEGSGGCSTASGRSAGGPFDGAALPLLLLVLARIRARRHRSRTGKG